ncbi:MAG: fasciclin domain-containing protein [Dysgonamonadaceae bacterium]|jgi:hypothetical protein|nr:fasciclin domain-containing protein [Dysgonamonadaceae bacterium]
MKVIYQSFLLLICTMVFVQCDNSVTDEYYERPSWLEPPIYEVLEQQGRFGHYLQCVERTEYAGVLKGAGLYTVFAPNDDAFTTWLQEKSYSSVADIPSEEATKSSPIPLFTANGRRNIWGICL